MKDPSRQLGPDVSLGNFLVYEIRTKRALHVFCR